MKRNIKVIVCGAGIGGLTAAHELSKRGFDVTIYERNQITGGLARSKYHRHKNKKYPVEYSWRVYGSNYKNLLRLMGEIPLSRDKNRSVFDNLVEVCTYIFPRFDRDEVVISKGKNKKKLIKNFSPRDLFKILNKTFYCLTMSKTRMDSLDHLKWEVFCSDLSPEAKKYLVQIWGPVLGMDTAHMSFPVVARMVGIILGGFSNYNSCLYLMDKPTNQGWFDEWAQYLQNKKDVKIKTGHEILDFKIESGKISSVVIKQGGDKFEDTADYYVCGMPSEAVAKIVAGNALLSDKPSLKNTVKLSQLCRQIQLSVQLFIDKKVVYPVKGKNVLYLPDTPWSLIIEPEDLTWSKTYCTDKKVKTILSVGICQTDMPGIIYKKPFSRCNREEVKEEVWQQILRSYKMSNILTEDGKKMDQAKILLFYIWDSFSFRDKKEVDTWEPKFSNNSNSLKYQPRHLTEMPNFFFATGYTKTDRFIYSMESAVEAGTLSANAIIKNEKKGKLTKVYKFKNSSVFLKPLILLDLLFYKMNLPHPSRMLFGNSLLLAALYFLSLFSLLMILILKPLFKLI